MAQLSLQSLYIHFVIIVSECRDIISTFIFKALNVLMINLTKIEYNGIYKLLTAEKQYKSTCYFQFLDIETGMENWYVAMRRKNKYKGLHCSVLL